MIIGQAIRAWRKERKLGLRELAKRIGVDYTALSKFERGTPLGKNWVKIMVWLLTP